MRIARSPGDNFSCLLLAVLSTVTRGTFTYVGAAISQQVTGTAILTRARGTQVCNLAQLSSETFRTFAFIAHSQLLTGFTLAAIFARFLGARVHFCLASFSCVFGFAFALVATFDVLALSVVQAWVGAAWLEFLFAVFACVFSVTDALIAEAVWSRLTMTVIAARFG